MSDAKALETPEQMAERLHPAALGWADEQVRKGMVWTIRADREAIASKCEQMAEEADAKAATWGQSDDEMDEIVESTRAETLRAVATMLRGSK